MTVDKAPSMPGRVAYTYRPLFQGTCRRTIQACRRHCRLCVPRALPSTPRTLQTSTVREVLRLVMGIGVRWEELLLPTPSMENHRCEYISRSSPLLLIGYSVPAHGVYEIPHDGPHELHAGTEPQEGGVMGFINRRSSIRKSGGVERYG